MGKVLSEIIFILTKVRRNKMKFRILVEMIFSPLVVHFMISESFKLHSASAAFLALVKRREARGLGHSSCWKGEKSEIKSENQVRLLGYLFHSFTKNQEFLMETSQPKVNLERRTNPPPWWLLSPLPSPGWQTNIEIVDSDSPRSRTITLWDLTLKELYVCHGHMAPMRVYLREIVR